MAHRTYYVILFTLLLSGLAFGQNLPRALIIGDSISIGYTPFVKELLAGKVEVVHNEGNAADSSNVLAKLDQWLAAGPFQVIHFNCGLHDLKFTENSKTFQVPPETYRENLDKIVSRLEASGAKLVWATTTPVVDERHAKRGAGFSRYEKDVLSYNKIAQSVMRSRRVRMNDLHTAVVRQGTGRQVGPDGVHYTEAGYRLLAEQVTEAISNQLGAGIR